MPKPFKLKPGELGEMTDAQRMFMPNACAAAMLKAIIGLHNATDDEGKPIFEKYGGDDEWPKRMPLEDVMKLVEY